MGMVAITERENMRRQKVVRLLLHTNDRRLKENDEIKPCEDDI